MKIPWIWPRPAQSEWHRSRRRLGTFFAYVGAISLVTYFFPDWVFNFDSPTDGPAYLSFMLDLVGQSRRFADHPMAELMSVFWPGHLFLSILPTRLGYFLYKILLASFLLYLTHQTAARLFGRGFGLAAAILVGTNGLFFQIHGSDYAEAIVMFYLTAVLYLVVRAAADSRRRWAWLLGVGLVCLVSSAFLTFAYLPGLGVLYLLLKRNHGRPWFEWSEAWIAAGAASCFALFCLGHRILAGTWFYMAIAFAKAQSFLAMDRTPGSPSEWFPGASWLFPGVIVIGYFLLNLGSVSPRLSTHLRRRYLRIGAPEALAAGTIISVGALSYLQFVKHQGTVSDRFYYNQLIPLVSLTLVGILFREFGPDFGRRRGVMVLCTIAAVWFANSEHSVPPMTLLWSCLGLVVVVVFARNAPRLLEAGIASCCWIGLVALSASISPVWTATSPFRPQAVTYVDQGGRTKRIRSAREESFTLIVDWMTTVRELDRAGKSWMWFDTGEPMGSWFRYLDFASHLFQARLINEYFPAVVVPDNDWYGPAHRKAAPGMEALIPTAMASVKLKVLEQTLAEQGMRYQLLARRPFVSGRVACEVLHIRILAL